MPRSAGRAKLSPRGGVKGQMSTGVANAPLEYAPGAPVRRRKRVRRAMLLVVLVGVVLAAWRWWPAARDQVTLLYWQRRCLNFEFPPDVVLYERDPTKAAALLRQTDPEYVPLPYYPHNGPMVTHAVYQPRALREFATRSAAGSSPGDRSIVFCHERRTPAGERRLVIVYAKPWSDFGPLWEWELYEPAGALGRAKLLGSGGDGNTHRGLGGGFGPSEHVGAGQPDAADPTHFTFPALFNGRATAVYDGRVTDQDRVVITKRAAAAKP
jgi:hypothetical protein